MSAEYSITQIPKQDKARWNNLLFKSLYPSYLQSISYEYSKERNNREISTFIFTLDGEDVAGVHYSVKRSKFNLLSTADILSGIVFKGEPKEELLRFIMQHFYCFAKSRSVAFIHLTPWLPMNIGEQKTDYKTLFNKVLFNFDFSIIENGRHTYWIDLNKSEKDLFENTKSQVRRKIRKAEKAELEVEAFTTFHTWQIETFYQLYKDLGKNKKFPILSKTKFFNEVRALMDEGAVLFFLKYKNQIIDVALTSNKGIATYYHGAVNPAYKRLDGCPSPGHYMQWVMITYMKHSGLETYDMAFCPGPVPINEHPNYGIWRFKYGFGGDHVQFLPVYGKVLNPITGKLFKYMKYRSL